MMETVVRNADAASISPLAPRSNRRSRTSRRSEGNENEPPSPLLHHNIIGKGGAKANAKPTSPLQQDDDASVKVVVRIRPVNRREREGVRIVRQLSSRALSIDGDERSTYTFDSVIGPDSSQEHVFDLVGAPLVKDALAGFNTSILSYGQTGSGKTYTMWGPPSAMVDSQSINSYQGVVPRIFHMLFAEIQNTKATSEEKQTNYQCRCSFLEIYNEQINDLLDPTQRNLQIRDDARSGFHVENLTEEYVLTSEDVTQILVKGLSNRKVGATSMNSKSSRSHIIFMCTIESWCKVASSKTFSSSKTSRISLVDLAGWDSEKIDGLGRHIMKEGKHVKQSLSKLGKVVNILAETAYSGKVQKIPYTDSSLTRLLQDTLGGNSKITFICAISPNDRQRAGTLSTLRFGERAKQMQNNAVINEITEDHVNGLSDQIRQLKEELIREKSHGGKSNEIAGAYFHGKNARDNLNLLRVSLNRSLVLPCVDNDSEEELDVDEDDVMELCSQLSNETSSIKEKSKDINEGTNSMSSNSSTLSSDAEVEDVMEKHSDSPKDTSMHQDAHSGNFKDESLNGGTSVPLLRLDCHNGSTMDCFIQDSPRKSSPSIVPCLNLPLLQDPTICLSPKIDSNLKKSITTPSSLSSIHNASECPLSISEKRHNDKGDPFRSSLQSSKIFPTESLAASIHRGMQIIDYHQRSSAADKSILALSFEHLASVSCKSAAKLEASDQTSPDRGNATPSLCSGCRKGLDVNNSAIHSSDMQIIASDDTVTPQILKEGPVKDDNKVLANVMKSKLELETICEEQAAMIRQLNYLVDKCRHEHGQTSIESQDQLVTSLLLKGSADGVTPIKEVASEGNHVLLEDEEAEMLRKEDVPEELQNKTQHTTTFDMREREALVEEIQNLKTQLKALTHASTDGSLLDKIRNGSSSPENRGTDYEKERQRWTESESRWISLAEELRVDLETNRRRAEMKDAELNLEKKCTEELDDALQRSILGHARIIEHYAELQEKYNDLLGRHRKVMEGIAEVKKAAAKAGGKGTSKAFAAALAAEISTLRVERERERAFLKEQNKALRIQLRDTAEAVHAAGELLVRLREAEEAVSLAEKKYGQAQQENEKLRKQVEKMKKKHAMEMSTMKHYLAESRLPESALGPLFHEDTERADATEPATFPDDDLSWRIAFTPSYQ